MKNGPYTLLIAPKDYPGKKYRDRYVYEHHLIWWKKTGQIIPKGYEIHHVNGDHRDNNPSNLKLLTGAEHRKVHGEMLKKPPIIFYCTNCGKQKTLQNNRFEHRKRKNKLGMFCSIKCGASFQFKTAGWPKI